MIFNLLNIHKDIPYHFKFVIRDYDDVINKSGINIEDNKIIIKLQFKKEILEHEKEMWINEIKEDYYAFLSKHHPEVTMDMIKVVLR